MESTFPLQYDGQAAYMETNPYGIYARHCNSFPCDDEGMHWFFLFLLFQKAEVMKMHEVMESHMDDIAYVYLGTFVQNWFIHDFLDVYGDFKPS